MPTPFEWIDNELGRLAERSLLRHRRVTTSLPNGRCLIDGDAYWNFASNDYLGLANDPKVIEYVRSSLDAGIGSRASALVTGRTDMHAELEERLAAFKGTEAAILYPTGFAANFGTITSLVGSEDIVFCDRLNHASLVDGARASKARFRVYPHCDVAFLERELAASQAYRRRLIVTDSLFSMDGDVAPLDKLADLAEKYDAMLLVDEAHGTGVFGEHGTGLLEEFNVKSPNVASIGTLSKAIGAQGGFAVGSRKLCDWFWNSARMNIYSTALLVPACVASIKAIEIIESEPQRRDWLRLASERVKEQLQLQGWGVPNAVRGPIIPVIIGDAARTVELAESLRKQEVFVAAIRPPTVPNGTSRLRISLSYAHGDEGIVQLLNAFERCRVE